MDTHSIHADQYRILDSVTEGCQIIDFDWRYLYINAAAAHHGRSTKEDLIGHTMMEKYPYIADTPMFGVLAACMRDRTPARIENEFTYPDGTRTWFDLSIQPIPAGLLIFSQDVTRFKQNEHDLKRAVARMEVLHQIDIGLIQGGAVQPLVEVTLKQLRTLIPCQRANVVAYDEETQEGVVFALDIEGETAVVPGVRAPIIPSMMQEMDAQYSVIVDDFRRLDTRDLPPLLKQIIEEGMISGLRVMLMDQDRPIGLLSLFADTERFFTPEHREIAIEIANQLSLAIRHLNLNRMLQQRATELEARVAERTSDLNKAKERVEAILDNSFDAILFALSDLSIQKVNSAFSRLFSTGSGEIGDKTVLDFIAPEDQLLVQTAIVQVLKDRQGKHIETRAMYNDGSVFEVEMSIGYFIGPSDGDIEGVVCTFRDITQRKTQERQLRYLASLQESVNDAVVVTDLHFVIQTWNKAAERIYGWRADEAIGRTTLEVLQTKFTNDETADRVRQEFLRRGYWTDEVIQRHRDGSQIYILSSVVLFKDNGVPFGIVAVNHDITERKRSEEALYQALAKEKELNELKSRFISMASHEFRTPLATILALTETLSIYRQRLSDTQIDERLAKIKDQIAHLKNIMEDVLLLARFQARRVDFHPAIFDLDLLCRSVLDEFQSQLGLARVFEYHCDPALKRVMLDKKLMRQLINNLVSNAIKYSSEQTTIVIDMRRENDALRLIVEDQGIGIPTDDLEHLFEPFHRASNVDAIPGTGLGLVIAKEAVEMHGGTIGVKSAVDMGTAFVISIPLPLEEPI